MSSGGRWLAVRGGALGDFVLTVPALDALSRHADHLTLAAEPRFAALLADRIDGVQDLHSPRALWLFNERPAPAPFDAAVAWTPGVAARLTALGVPRVYSAAPRPRSGASAARHVWRPVSEALGLGADPPPPRLSPSPHAQRVVHALLGDQGPGIVLAPGASAPEKRWSHFGALAELLVAQGRPVWWAPGRDEASLGRSLPGRVLPVLGLDDLLALATRCRCWVGNDTGTTHLARAAGAPVVAFFGPTDPETWGPPGARILSMEASPRTALREVDCAVLALVNKR